MYVSVKTKSVISYASTPIFCVRRLLLVLSLLALRDQKYWLLSTYNVIQSLYLWYITMVKPHEDPIHNQLEIFNELCIIMI